MNVLIRADASSSIGLGHIMRTQVLAKEFEHVSFACFENPLTLPYPIHWLKSMEVSELIALVHALHVDLLVIDHYGIDDEAERTIKAQTDVTLMVLDDTYERHHCDILLNHNICADASRYEGLVPPHCTLRCGGAFTLLREEFTLEKECVREREGVLIALGGSDVLNLTPQILALLPKSVHVTLITSSANANLSALRRAAQVREHTELIIDASDMARRLHACALAVVSSSTLSQEALFLDTPILAIQTAPNQSEMADYLQRHGHSVLRRFDEETFLKALDALL